MCLFCNSLGFVYLNMLLLRKTFRKSLYCISYYKSLKQYIYFDVCLSIMSFFWSLYLKCVKNNAATTNYTIYYSTAHLITDILQATCDRKKSSLFLKCSWSLFLNKIFQATFSVQVITVTVVPQVLLFNNSTTFLCSIKHINFDHLHIKVLLL